MIVEDTSLDESELEVDLSKVDPKESVETEFDEFSSEELVVDSED